MYFDPSLGMQGNIEKSLQENQYRANEIYNETSTRTSADTQLELARTDAELNDIEANQLITELDLRVLELEEKTK